MTFSISIPLGPDDKSRGGASAQGARRPQHAMVEYSLPGGCRRVHCEEFDLRNRAARALFSRCSYATRETGLDGWGGRIRTPASGICIPLASLLWCLAEQFAPPAWRNSCPRRVAKEDELFRVLSRPCFKGAFGLQNLAHPAALRREEEPQRSASPNSACGKNARIGRAASSDRCR